MNAPFISTEKFVIRPLAARDLKTFAQYRSQAEVAKYQSWSDYSYQDALALFEGTDYSTFGEVGNWYQLAISRHESEELVGDLALHFIDDAQIEIGFTVNPKYHRQNVATEALSGLLVYVFGNLKMHRVVATTDTENGASHRLLEKLGFRREAHFVQNIFFKGSWGDEYQYALLQTEQKFA